LTIFVRLADGYATRRFKEDAAFDKVAFGEYLYHNAAATHGSGERALGELLLPYAWAKSPLCYRIPKLSKAIPIHFIYGDNDWMDHRHADKVKEEMQGTHTVTVETIAGAGHQVFLDAPQAFNDAVLRLCGVSAPRAAPVATPAPELAQQADAAEVAASGAVH
jgi:pimeloyl-ACP methyl ester carboxylesterase